MPEIAKEDCGTICTALADAYRIMYQLRTKTDNDVTVELLQLSNALKVFDIDPDKLVAHLKPTNFEA